jgi:hypothetical protein
MNMNAPVIVFGEGSSALFLIEELTKRNETIFWVDGSGAKLLPVMPHVQSAHSLSLQVEAAKSLGISIGSSVERGLCHRVFRSKAFKLSNWKKMEEQTWAPELAFIDSAEYRVEGLDPAQVEEGLRSRLATHPLVTRIENTPVVEFEVFTSGGKIQFANGTMTEFRQLYFCDDLSSLKGFPKLSTIFKNQMKGVRTSSRHGALQVVFHHSVPLKQFMNRGLVIPMNRDSGETFDRDVLGYFMEPTRSVWTVLLQPSECEENHEIMKKLRKLKQSLNRAFESPEFLPEGKKEFMSTVEKEMVRFEASFLYTEGELQASSSNPDFVLFTDSFGYSQGLERIAHHFGIPPMEFGIETAEVSGDLNSLDLDSIEIPSHVSGADDIQEIPQNI